MMEPRATRRTYLWIFVGLALLTAIELGAAALTFNETLRIIILLSLAGAKVVLVATYYMHLKYDHRVLSMIVGFPLLLVLIMLLFFLADQNLGA